MLKLINQWTHNQLFANTRMKQKQIVRLTGVYTALECAASNLL